MSISFHEIAQDCASFYTSGSVTDGQLCYLSASSTIHACTDGTPIHGRVLKVRSGVASVILHGFIKVRYTGTAPTLGYCPLVAFNGLTVQVSEGAKEYLVVDVNTKTNELCILL